MSSKEEYFAANGAKKLRYDPETGEFTWLDHRMGMVAGSLHKATGYRRVSLGPHKVSEHRYAWFVCHGYWPIEVDHLNGKRDDNRLANLRATDASGNRMNQAMRSDNRSGVTGVFYNPRTCRWMAQIWARGQRKRLGSFMSLDAARDARLAAEAALGFGPNHGAAR